LSSFFQADTFIIINVKIGLQEI